MYDEETYDYLDPYTKIINDMSSTDVWAYYPFQEYESSHPQFMIVRMFWLTPPLVFSFALWYDINFYITVVGFVFEFLLFLAMFSNMLKKKSELRSYYYVLTCIIILFDMVRFFLPADYRFVPSFFFHRQSAELLRYIHIVYGFFMSIFVPVCQLALTLNRLTAVMVPLKHKKIWSPCYSLLVITFVIALPVLISVPYARRQNTSHSRPLFPFLSISIGMYLKIIILLGIGLASIATIIGMTVLIRFFVIRKKAIAVAFELRLLIVVMTSNIGCIGYNICQLCLYRAYLSEDLQYTLLKRDWTAMNQVYFFDELSKSILILHHYTSFIILIYMSSAVRNALMQAALYCIEYCATERVERYTESSPICENLKKCLKCFSKINNTECFAPDILAQDHDVLVTDPIWIDLLMNINMCGSGSNQDLVEIKCLFGKQMLYAEHCGMMELDDCEKRLESIQCRMKYIQSKCNTATAMKLCENYIIEGDHCVDTVTQCRNMTFKKDKGPLTRDYEDYKFDLYDYYYIHSDYDEDNDYNCTKFEMIEFGRLRNCLYTFEKRQEIPLWRFPLFLNDLEKFPIDVRTVSRYCQAIEELMTCLGRKFTENCINGTNDKGIDFLMRYNSSFQFTLVGERLLCPSKRNGITMEDFICFLNISKHMPLNTYACIPRRYSVDGWDYDVEDNIRKETMICQLQKVDKTCGRNMSAALCQVFASGNMDYVGWPKFEYSCNLYRNYKCQCSI